MDRADSYALAPLQPNHPESGRLLDIRKKLQPIIVRWRELANIDLYHQVRRSVRYAYLKLELVPCMLIDTGVTPSGQVVSFLLVSTQVC